MGQYNSKPKEKERNIKPHGFQGENYTKITPSYMALYDGIVSLAEENKYSDLTVICGSDRFLVHRAIVCSRSAWFAEKCQKTIGDRKDYSCPFIPMKIWTEPGEESQIIASILNFLYTLNYADKTGEVFIGSTEYNDDHDYDRAEDSETTSETGTVTEGGHVKESSDEETLFRSPSPTTSSSHIIPTPSSSDAGILRSSNISNTSSTNPNEHSQRAYPSPLVHHTQIHCAAHRFTIPSLATVSLEKLRSHLWKDNEVWKVELLPAIREAYRHPEYCDLRDALLDGVCDWGRRKWFKENKRDEWEAAVVEFSSFRGGGVEKSLEVA
ncbi:hypothetical protein M501DRAFT_1053922 [Patellaria atrata CBS 101060]|uniref:BTB domain-containing protein n=1 Tax=Patellaria atrata CBS 101060 TaxID=1346257 RepID=A0A9P4SIZ9_9PEZI|nr:hypothetical protein M501DRAFT_1053922 [Patellaria atrata CBS 101060]